MFFLKKKDLKILVRQFVVHYLCTINHEKKKNAMKKFFNSDEYTEFFVPETNEIWVFGDTPENITESTPHQFVGKAPHWGDGTEETAELPITDGHGTREYVTGRVYVASPGELSGTTAESQISKFWKFNA